MGTRGFVGFLTPERELRGSYNHFDSYPSELGKNVQTQLADIFLHEGWTWDTVREKAAAIRWVDDSESPSDEDRERYKHLWQQVSTGKDWYSLLRDAQGNLAFMLKEGIAGASHDFPRDSLFCEWGYLLDLDAEEVVILRGFNNDESRQADYAQVSKENLEQQDYSGGVKYYGCYELWRGSLEFFLGLDMDEVERDDANAREREAAEG